MLQQWRFLVAIHWNKFQWIVKNVEQDQQYWLLTVMGLHIINKCNDSWNNINDPYAKLYVVDVVKAIN